MITYYHEKSPKQKYLGRPVLIIVDSLKRLKQLQLLFSDCQIIDGIHPEKDKEAIEKAGEKGRITIATLAAGSVAAKGEYRLQWVKDFWNTPLRTGNRRYYDNCLYFFSLLLLSGEYKIY